MTHHEVAISNCHHHEIMLDEMPNDPHDAIESLACFVANVLLSIGCSPDEFRGKVNEYLHYYDAVDQLLEAKNDRPS